MADVKKVQDTAVNDEDAGSCSDGGGGGRGSVVSRRSSSAKENQDPEPPGPASKKRGRKRKTPSVTQPKKKRQLSIRSFTSPIITPKRSRRLSGASVVSDVKSTVSAASTPSTSGVKAKEKKEEKEKEEVIVDEDDSSDSDDEDGKGEGVFVVERIDKKDIIDGVAYYYIKWKGWEEKHNTWEPIEHLDGCPKIVEDFEKEWAEKNKKKASKRRVIPARRKHPSGTNEDSRDLVLNLKKTESNMKSYGVHSKWPLALEPVSVEGVVYVDGVLTYVVKKNARLASSKGLDRNNAVLVQAPNFREEFPQLVIQYYEGRVLWCTDGKTNEQKAAVAAQMTIMNSYRKSKLGKEIALDIDQGIQIQLQTGDAKKCEDGDSKETSKNGSKDKGEAGNDAMEVEMDQEMDDKNKSGSELDEDDDISNTDDISTSVSDADSDEEKNGNEVGDGTEKSGNKDAAAAQIHEVDSGSGSDSE